MTGVADTSFLIALLSNNDDHHDEAVRRAAEHDVIYVPHVVLAETLNVVQHKARRAETGESPHATALRALEALAAQPTVILGEPPHDHEAAVRVWRAHAKLTYIDAAAVAAARAKGVGLCTFDKDQLVAHKSGKP